AESLRAGFSGVRAGGCVAFTSTPRDRPRPGNRAQASRAALGHDLGGERARKGQPILLYAPAQPATRLVAARILIVEDSPLVTDAFRVLFTDAGYEVDAAATVAEGIERGTADRVDLML